MEQKQKSKPKKTFLKSYGIGFLLKSLKWLITNEAAFCKLKSS